MQLRLIAFGLILVASACLAPPAGATGESVVNKAGSGNAAEARHLARQGRAALATQQAARLETLPLSEVTPAGASLMPQPPALPRPRPAIVRGSRPLQCVPYARELSQIALRGNAWTWWTKAEGRYEKGHTPQPGAILVFSKTRRLRLGHLAVVAKVMNSREILVHQANWLNRGKIHRFTPVRDISKNNDWSEVRVWYTPGRVYGSGRYQAYGFIYPKTGVSPELRQASN